MGTERHLAYRESDDLFNRLIITSQLSSHLKVDVAFQDHVQVYSNYTHTCAFN